MKVVVFLSMYTDGQTRTVDIGNVEFAGSPEEQQLALLDAVFVNGQNEVQPLQRISVSVGDVICHNGLWRVDSAGFSPMTDEEFEDYMKLDRRERHFWTPA